MSDDHTAFLQMVGVQPNRYGLLLWLAENLTAADVERLAEADAGFDLEDNRKALNRLLQAGELQGDVDVGESWLKEVCSMLMWESAEQQCSVAEHRSVVLACTVLILAGAPGESLDGHVHSQSDPIVTLVVSVRHLGDEACSLARAMLADGVLRWAGNDCSEPEDLLCGLGIIALCDDVPDEAFAWVLRLEEEWFVEVLGSRSSAWLWRLTFFDQSKEIWRRELLAATNRCSANASADDLMHAKVAAVVSAWP